MNQIRNERVVLSRRNEEENSSLRFVRNRRIQELARAESMMKERRRAHQSLAVLLGSSPPGFSSGLGRTQRDLVSEITPRGGVNRCWLI